MNDRPPRIGPGTDVNPRPRPVEPDPAVLLAGMKIVHADWMPAGLVLIGHPDQIARILADEPSLLLPLPHETVTLLADRTVAMVVTRP